METACRILLARLNERVVYGLVINVATGALLLCLVVVILPARVLDSER
jgi:hypothetical protein